MRQLGRMWSGRPEDAEHRSGVLRAMRAQSMEFSDAEANIPLDTLRIGHLDGDLYDPRCGWLRHRQIAADGAILVRPDRFVAWRCPGGVTDPRGALAAVFSQILARSVG